MNPQLTNVAVLGSTGSIGRNALEVIAASGNRLQATVLSAYSNVELLLEQARQIRPRFVVAVDPAAAGKVDWSTLPKECTLLTGAAALAGAGLAAPLRHLPWLREADLPFVYDPATAALPVAASLALGLLFSLAPAWRAARIEPAEALRGE